MQCALRRWEEDFSLINMRWLLQPEKVSASVFLHGRQFDLQTGRQSAPAGQAAALVVVRYRVAGLGRLSAGANMAMKPFVKCVITIFATNASFLRVISNFRI